MPPTRTVCALHCAFCLLLLSGCAPKALSLPTGRGTPLPDAAGLHSQVSAHCGSVRTLTAELGLSGRAGDQRLSGRALVGFEAPDRMRLEGVAPFGPPAFILAARRGEATLLLPRDERVLRGARPGEILGALTGVPLAPADLQAILTGCVVPGGKVTAGSEQRGWAVLELEGGPVLYLRRSDGAWRLRAATRDEWQVEYADWQGDFPRTVRLLSAGPAGVDMTARLSQLEVNTGLDDAAFTIDVPGDALPITIDELRRAGPLRAASTSR